MCKCAMLTVAALASLAHGMQSEQTCPEAPAVKTAALMQLRTQASSPSFNRSSGHRFGSASCPCIGFDNISGSTLVLSGSTKLQYPADVGAHCAAWDDDRDPFSCKDNQHPGIGKGWCAQQWCFVDPCNCDLPLEPKASTYLPDAQYQGKPLYYSYATCGGDEHNSIKAKHVEAEKPIWSVCEKNVYDLGAWGKQECKCIGIGGVTGTTNFTVGGKRLAVPAETGTKCASWDLQNNPECSESNTDLPGWCVKQWCFVDPCSCSLAVSPKQSTYLPHASVDGRAVYYSYETCNSGDLWTTSNNKYACINQNTSQACTGLYGCGWDADKQECLGRYPLHECKKALAEAAKEVADEAAARETAASRSMKKVGAKLEAAKKAEETAGQKLDDARSVANVPTANASEEFLAAAEAYEREAKASERNATAAEQKAVINAERADRMAQAIKAFADATRLEAAGTAQKLDTAKIDVEDARFKVKEAEAAVKRWNKLEAAARATEKESEAKAVDKQSKASAAAHELGAAKTVEEAAAVNAAKKAAIAEKALKIARESAPHQWVYRKYGKPACPCIGLDNLTGTMSVVRKNSTETTEVQYPVDAGAHCAAWDDNLEPSSAHRWCFVDPCNCNVHMKPKASSYLPDGQYQGKPLYYSHATCDKVRWIDEAKEVKTNNSSCKRSADDSADWGKQECKCIGIAGLTGTTNFTVGRKHLPFPAETGSKCEAWDLERNPECVGSSHEIPAWCIMKWCLVDPCSCSIPVSPHRSTYLPDASIRGKSVYYSYDTCSNDDFWTATSNKHACVNLKSQESCAQVDECDWDYGKRECLGEDLVHDCKHSKVINVGSSTSMGNNSSGKQDSERSASERTLATCFFPAIMFLLVVFT